jgi:hypothetical protein
MSNTGSIVVSSPSDSEQLFFALIHQCIQQAACTRNQLCCCTQLQQTVKGITDWDRARQVCKIEEMINQLPQLCGSFMQKQHSMDAGVAALLLYTE